ncbi:MAG: hypothetical protein WAT09_03625 [Paracoccaceae bacterium]
MWADPNLKNFHGRIARIEKARAKGYGFEAKGTLGRSATYHRERPLMRLVKALSLVLLTSIGLKGVIHYYVGAAVYDERVTTMMLGEGFDRLGGTLMQADPVTLTISQVLTAVFPK